MQKRNPRWLLYATGIATIVSAIVAYFSYVHPNSSGSGSNINSSNININMPTPAPTAPAPTPTPSPMWELTISSSPYGSVSNQPSRFNTNVVAHVVNQASDGNTHTLLVSSFALHPVINGTTDFNLSETLVSPDGSASYLVNHNSSIDVSLTYSVPCSRNRLALHLVDADTGWAYSVTPPAYCSF